MCPSVVVNKGLERGQEVVVEKCEVVLLLDVGLNQSEDVSPDRLHRLSQVVGVRPGHHDRLRNALAVNTVDPDEVFKNSLQVIDVKRACTLDHSDIGLDNEVNSLDVLLHVELLNVLVGAIQDVPELCIGILQETRYKLADHLSVREGRIHHPAHAFVHLQFLVRLEVFQV